MSNRLLSGRYELLEKIGEGGMAVVYKAKDKLLNRFIAVKILRPEFTKDASFVENFKRESQSAASLSHPNIVGVYDVGREGNINYIVMELIEGKTLSELIAEEAPMDYKKVIDITKQLASALKVAHANNIIHRDVKPHNILITEDGTAKLADFGIAKAVNDATLTTNNSIIGSVHYFSPEQARGNYVDERSDIYSLGIVMYEMLTGKVPFDADNPVSIALKHINDEIVPPTQLVRGIPPALERTVLKATDKFQSNRCKSAEELIEELDNIEFVTRVVGNSVFLAASEQVEKSRQNESEENEKQEDLPSEKGKKRKFLANLGEGKKKRNIIIAVVIAVCLIPIIYLLSTMIGTEELIEVPNLENMSYDEATTTLEDLNLKIEKGDDVFSTDVEEGNVAEQDPASGEEVKAEMIITVNISKGSKEGAVPNLVDMNEDSVEDYLDEYGFVLGSVKTETNTEPEGTVLSQSPAAGTLSKKGERVDIVVSDGKGEIEGVVPMLVGEEIEAAKKLITDAGFEVGAIGYDYSDIYAEGYVMWQEQAANTNENQGTFINVKVSKGEEVIDPPVVDVPVVTEPVVTE
ncbi:MAG: Stk1 family PASTA domain-containing Ser/Thr kinase [Peptostreptococcaceae bacterium]|nr:Stk1 family PASTA domain-containing Ser/Thr kinase [Peptostreptococcaceae bacterium]